MWAWQFTHTHEPLSLVEVADPTAGLNEVVVTVMAAGICHSDVGLLQQADFPRAPGARFPMTLGHEIAGVISEVGAGVTDWEVGDRVALALVGGDIPGVGRDGGFAAQVSAPAEVLVRIPAGVTFAQAAVATDAGVTAYHAVVVAGNVGPGVKVGIIGLGGLGQMGARAAVLAGAEVFVADIKPEVWPLAESLGVKRVGADIREFADEDLDVIVDLAGFGSTTASAIETVRRGGTVVQVGMGRLEATISTRSLIMKQVTLRGVLGGEKADLSRLLELVADGHLTPALTLIDFTEIPEGLRQLSADRVVGRLVVDVGRELTRRSP